MKNTEEKYNQFTRPGRTLIRAEEVTKETFKFIVPSWDGGREVIELPSSSLPENIIKAGRVGHLYFTVDANTGAETSEDLVFDHWKLD